MGRRGVALPLFPSWSTSMWLACLHLRRWGWTLLPRYAIECQSSAVHWDFTYIYFRYWMSQWVRHLKDGWTRGTGNCQVRTNVFWHPKRQLFQNLRKHWRKPFQDRYCSESDFRLAVSVTCSFLVRLYSLVVFHDTVVGTRLPVILGSVGEEREGRMVSKVRRRKECCSALKL